MSNWLKQVAGAILVLALALGVGGFILLLRAQQNGQAASMAAADIQTVSPPDGATGIPVSGDIRAEYIQRPSQDPTIKLEPTDAVTLSGGHWEGTTFVIYYSGLRDNGVYHVELDQDQASLKGEHKQIDVRWAFRTGAPVVTPRPTAAEPTASPKAPPPNVSLIWYSYGTSNLVASDWDGRLVGSSSLRIAGQSPDGSKLLVGAANAPILDSAGQTLGRFPDGVIDVAWADDSSGLCGLSGAFKLVWVGLNGKTKTIADVSPPSQLFQVPKLAACSNTRHQALVYYVSYGNIYSLRLISLANGGTLYQRSYANPIRQGDGLVASQDAQYVAEVLGAGGASMQIRQLPSGNVVGQLTGIYPRGFSWDGSLLVGDISGYSGVGEARVINWQTGQILWQAADDSFPFVLAQPFGTDVAVAIWVEATQLGQIYVIDPQGNAKLIASNPWPMQPF